jgi:hypothetical protein
MSSVIYVETSIPSFYFDTRTSTEMRAKRKWTREWWDAPKIDTDLVTSLPVLRELERIPNETKRQKSLALIQNVLLLPYSEEIDEILEVYFEHKLMPREAMGDADHLALASFHKCDMLVTWNCKHLANANKFGHIHRINALLGLPTPALVTPLQLLEKADEDET